MKDDSSKLVAIICNMILANITRVPSYNCTNKMLFDSYVRAEYWTKRSQNDVQVSFKKANKQITALS